MSFVTDLFAVETVRAIFNLLFVAMPIQETQAPRPSKMFTQLCPNPTFIPLVPPYLVLTHSL